MFDTAQVLIALESVVDQTGPDFIYRDNFQWCKYVQDEGDPEPGAPACIVGRLLGVLGLPQPDANEQRFEATEAVQHFTPEANDLIQRAQDIQDGNTPNYPYHGESTYGEILADARTFARTRLTGR